MCIRDRTLATLTAAAEKPMTEKPVGERPVVSHSTGTSTSTNQSAASQATPAKPTLNQSSSASVPTAQRVVTTQPRQATTVLRTTTSPAMAKPVTQQTVPTTATKTAMLPQTGEQTNRVLTVLGFVLLAATSLFGFSKQQRRHKTTD